jgi:hypothetical protein
MKKSPGLFSRGSSSALTLSDRFSASRGTRPDYPRMELYETASSVLAIIAAKTEKKPMMQIRLNSNQLDISRADFIGSSSLS